MTQPHVLPFDHAGTETTILHALPRIDGLPVARQGFDRESVSHAFAIFESHLAALQAQLAELASREDHVALPGNALRADALTIIEAATDYANRIEREAQVAAVGALRATAEEVEQQRHRLREDEADLQRRVEAAERECERLLRGAREEAQRLLSEATHKADAATRRGEKEATRVIEEGAAKARELIDGARARTDELLDWSRRQSAETLEEARATAQGLLSEIEETNAARG